MTVETATWDDCFDGEFPLDAMKLWFKRHGIDPYWVPAADSFVSRHLRPDLPGISFEQCALDSDGKLRVVDDEAVREAMWVPMEADPLPFPDELGDLMSELVRISQGPHPTPEEQR